MDIALPRDIEPAVGELDGVYLYNVDDLEEMASQNRVERQHELQAATKLSPKRKPFPVGFVFFNTHHCSIETKIDGLA